MTVLNFKKYIESKTHISKIVFLTENQRWYRVSDPCKISLAFTDIRVYENPNMIYLHLSDQPDHWSDCMVFDRVDEIRLNRKLSVLGDVATVKCGGGEYTYTLIIEE